MSALAKTKRSKIKIDSCYLLVIQALSLLNQLLNILARLLRKEKSVGLPMVK